MRIEVTYRVTLNTIIDIGELYTDAPYFEEMLKGQLGHGDFEGENPRDYEIEDIKNIDYWTERGLNVCIDNDEESEE